MVDLSIILPTYNERKNIILLIKKIVKQLKDKPLSYEILVVDDDSPDKTWEIVNQYALKSLKTPISPICIEVLRRLTDHGLAASILEGIQNAKGQNILVMDSDFNHDPKMIWQMYRLLEFYDFIVGSRFVSNGGMEDRNREKASFIFNLFIRILLGTHIQDNLSGFFVMKKEKLLPFANKEIFIGYGEYFIRLLYRARHANYKILEVPVFYKLRPH